MKILLVLFLALVFVILVTGWSPFGGKEITVREQILKIEATEAAKGHRGVPGVSIDPFDVLTPPGAN